MIQRPVPPLAGFCIAAFLVIIATALTKAMGPLILATPAALFFGAVALASWRGGWWPGVAATVLSIFSINFFLSEPLYTTIVHVRDIPSMLVFCLVAGIISYTTNKQLTAERLATQKEGELRRVLDNMNETFFMMDNDWRIVHINDHFEKFTGHPREKVIGKHLLEAYPEVRGSEYEAKYLEAKEAGTPVRHEMHSKKLGLWFELRAVPTSDGLSVFLTDITEAREAERGLIEREEQLRLALTGAGMGDWEWNIADDSLRLSEHASAIFGREEQKPQTFAELLQFVHPDEREMFRREVQRAVAEAQDFNNECRISWLDGSVHWISLCGRAYYSSDGKPERMMGVVADVTERYRNEAERRELEKRFRTMADSAPVLIWISDLSKQCTWFNKTWLEFTGRTLDEEYGFGWAAGVHPDDVDRCVQIYTSSFDTRQKFAMEYRLKRHDGAYRWVLDNGIPLYDSQNNFSGFIGSCIDITDLKNTQDENALLLAAEREARNEAERASSLKDEFLATLSHELRTPLNAILGWSQLLRDSRLDDSERTIGMAAIERSTRSQMQLIGDLLDMSRVVSGKLWLKLERVDLVAVTTSAVESILPLADEAEVSVHHEARPGVVPVVADTGRVQQIVWNLLTNAVKFTSAGGRVELRLRRVGEAIEIEVCDTGCGISAEFLPHVFDRFRQQDSSTTRRFGGLGLGLSIVRNLVDLHGGTISVHSAGEGKGSTFTVALPIESASSEGNRLKTARVQTVTPGKRGPKLNGLSILVVDDEPDTRELMQRLLALRGGEVQTAASASEALELLDTQQFDLLISDIGMPEQDGYNLIDKVRSGSAAPEIPAIALTAFARDEDRNRALQAGYQVHLSKPVEPSRLVEAVAELVGVPQETAEEKRSAAEL